MTELELSALQAARCLAEATPLASLGTPAQRLFSVRLAAS